MLPITQSYKMPPEWCEHERTFMEWPIVEAIWPGPYNEVVEAFVQVIKKIASFEPVTVIVRPEYINDANKLIGNFTEILELQHDDSWIRDNGPTFIVNKKGELAGVNWIFNAWGNKYPCINDNLVAANILDKYKIKRFDAPFVMEGGSIHVDGEGILLTTKQCLLNKERNPDFNEIDIQNHLNNYLDVKKIIWLNNGWDGDDTDGHVDNVACFASPGRIIIQVCNDENDANFEISKENIEILKNSTDAVGRKFDIIEIEQPRAVYYEEMRLTLSYLNFYFVNGGVILPIFGGINKDRDENAIKILSEVFPDRKIETVSGIVLARGGGNVHCATQQMPKVGGGLK